MAAGLAVRSSSQSSVLQRELLHSASYGKLHRSYCQLKGVRTQLRANLESVSQNCNAEESEQRCEIDAGEMLALRSELKMLLSEQDVQKQSEEALAAEVADLRIDLRNTRSECDDRNALLVRASLELHSFRSKVTQLHSEQSAHEHMKREVHALRKEAKVHAQEMATVQEALEQLHLEYELCSTEAKKQATCAAAWHSEMIDAKAERDDCAERSEGVFRELSTLREELSHSHLQCREQGNEISHTLSEFKCLQSELDCARSQPSDQLENLPPKDAQEDHAEELAVKLREVTLEVVLLTSELRHAQSENASSETRVEAGSKEFRQLCTEFSQEKSERDSCAAFARNAHTEIACVLPVMKRTQIEYEEACERAEQAIIEVASLRLQVESAGSKEEMEATRGKFEAERGAAAMREELAEASADRDRFHEQVLQMSADRDCLAWQIEQDATELSELQLKFSKSLEERMESVESAAGAEAHISELRAALEALRADHDDSANKFTTLKEELTRYKNLSEAAGEADATIKDLQAEVQCAGMERDAEMHHARALSAEISVSPLEVKLSCGAPSGQKRLSSPLLSPTLSSPSCAYADLFSLSSSDGFHAAEVEEGHIAERHGDLMSEIVVLSQKLNCAFRERDAERLNMECATAEISALQCKLESLGTEQSQSARRTKRASSESRKTRCELKQARCEAEVLHNKLLLSMDSTSTMKMQSAQLRAELATARADLAGEAAALSMAKVEGAAERRHDSVLCHEELVVAFQAEKQAAEAQAAAQCAERAAAQAQSVLSKNQEQLAALTKELANGRAQTARLCEQTGTVVLGVVEHLAIGSGIVHAQEQEHLHWTPPTFSDLRYK